MNSEWSLDELYKGFDDPKFAADLAKYDEMIVKTNEFAAKISDMQPLDALKTYIAGRPSLFSPTAITVPSIFSAAVCAFPDANVARVVKVSHRAMLRSRAS